MPNDYVNMLWQAIDILDARELLVKMTIQDWPNMKPSARQSLHKKIYKTAYPKVKKRAMTLDDLENALRNPNGR